MSAPTIAFIGAGNMGSALIKGLIASKQNPAGLSASCPSIAHLNPLREHYGIHITTDNTENILRADVIILAVKPQIIQTVAAEIAPSLTQRKPLIISIAAGVEIQTLQ